MILILRKRADTTNSKEKKREKKIAFPVEREKKPLPFVHFYLHRMKIEKKYASMLLNIFMIIFFRINPKVMNLNDLEKRRFSLHTHTCMSCRKIFLFLLQSHREKEQKERSVVDDNHHHHHSGSFSLHM